MGTEVEHASADVQNNLTAAPSTSASGQKISMFAKKSGFVIPKNKLSGSLVPVHRGTKKGDADLVNEDGTNQVARKTKWGPDLTLDTSVRKGRALAYQARINQISEQLTLGTVELDGHGDSLSTLDHQFSKEESDLLELERREIIGELLKLNPAYKAPADYKPLLKEAKVPIPIKEHPGYNFIGLVFGPANDTQKRLEKETGAKMQVYGIKSDTRGKVEFIPTDGKEIDNAYENLYVQVSADTFEKIDAAVALIELLLATVSENPVPFSTTSTSIPDNNMNTNQNAPSLIISPSPTNQGGQPPPPQGQLPQYRQQWFSPNQAHTPTYFPNPYSATVLISNTVQSSSSSLDPPTTGPLLFGPFSGVASSFSPVSQNPSVFLPRPRTALQPTYMQQAPPLGQTGGPRNNPVAPLAGPSFSVRPVLSTPTPPIVPSHGHNIVMAPQHTVVSPAPPVNIPNNMIAPQFGLSQPEHTHPAIQPLPIGPTQPTMAQSICHGVPAMPFPLSAAPNSVFGGSQGFDTVKPSLVRPQQPSSGDFTFRPHNRPPSAASQVWQSNHQPAPYSERPLVGPVLGSLARYPAMLRPGMGDLNPPVVQGFPGFQINRPRIPFDVNFAGNRTVPLPSRHSKMPMEPHMQPRNFVHQQPMNNQPGPFPPRPMHMLENQLWPQQRFSSPHQRFGSQPGRPFSSSSGGQQVYDPFSPSSVPFKPQVGGKTRARSESDPEYEDLMASVGVQ